MPFNVPIIGFDCGSRYVSEHMATGLSSQLTRQIGEHLVTAELGRRGIVATPFAGNVPDIDILAYASGRTKHIQVKAINKGDWQLDIRKFLDIGRTDKGQMIQGRNQKLDRETICVFVSLDKKPSEDEFYIFKQGWLQDHCARSYKARKPPRNVDSFHYALRKSDVQTHLDKWEIIKSEFRI